MVEELEVRLLEQPELIDVLLVLVCVVVVSGLAAFSRCRKLSSDSPPAGIPPEEVFVFALAFGLVEV